MIKSLFAGIALAAATVCAAPSALAQADGTIATWSAKPAHVWAAPTHMMLMDATRAGPRIVAVGERGLVLLSDNDGKSFRQAHSVPVSATLSAVNFTDAQHGWAVGQWGVILATTDGGETWQKQRMDISVDQPLFSVLFTSEKDGIAVGLWSLMLATHDGGKTWTKVAVPKPPGNGRADRNLYHIFADRSGALYIDSEQGMVLKSTDSGANWSYLATGGKGTLWTGVALPDGRIVVGGLLGSLYQSSDGGATWTALNAGTKSSITDLVATRNGLMGVGLDGLVLRQREGGMSFEVQQRDDRATLTAALIDGAGKPVLFSQDGVLTAH
ncbi:TPA: glycosyl hydrolase [Burkholderia aenigmatica]|uniref:WD40/YVTN/BNR-like repeat-containing protein n=1 Tax=Burkholderia sp. AU45251 TaxID=3059204 RepID=UPI002652EA62|nr:YCF48-related protein [Burkholderia sp. AU45251]HDR9482578.1 glycosyl hydrolase [Burkholderia aenigmatica]MDN7517738.1 YCF48-related protein [Burkholderia sp. AU45251]HDR9513525.1 glycosyl hydrolase [Burkholderia aenigmatica]HDR9590916.1 glycosyl hydrolase [Burkholderia aenigmatica]HDR9601704.1 glycosyl hydrolase [Burkholderia aenigmatica]